jgi:hypothetical protein
MKSLYDYILLEKNWDKYISVTYNDIIKNAILYHIPIIKYLQLS